ncbi:MAG: acyl-CoA desaturase [Rivularia sp. (in: cyanobacteria)]
MQLDSTTSVESIASSRQKPKPKITIKSDKLKAQMRIHALLVSLIPALASVIAIVIACQTGVGLLEVGLLVFMYTLTIGGMTVGFHRHFAHRAFQTNTIIRVILAILGSMACQGPLIYWVSNHRRHHQYSDRPGDTHSPYFKNARPLGGFQIFWYSHIGWTFDHEITNTFLFTKDLLRDPIISKVNRLYYLWIFLGLAIPTLLGGLLTLTWMGALSGLLWGGFVRIFLSYHASLGLSSINHLYGNRPFNTDDQSTNNILLAILTNGEGWHNNHHAFPNSAKFGLKWWQIDLGYWAIRTLEVPGLVWDVKVPTTGMIEAKTISQN